MQLFLSWVLVALALTPSATSDPADRPPDIGVVGVAQVKQWSSDRLSQAESSFSGSRYASPVSWHDEVVYQIQVDRFQNGNLSNDNLNLPAFQQQEMRAGSYKSLPEWRHGGDIAGVNARLGYLQELGITTLWLTPLLHSDGSYHGYCTTADTSPN